MGRGFSRYFALSGPFLAGCQGYRLPATAASLASAGVNWLIRM